MKRSLAITATTAMLALSLAGCGAERNGDVDLLPDFDGGGAGTGTTATDTMQNGAGTMNGTGTNAGASTNSGLNSVTGAVNRGTSRYGMTSRDYAGGSATYGVGGPNSSVYTATNNGGVTAMNGGGASFYDNKAANDRYQLMLENAHVHDTDGFLLDGENAHYHTF